MNKNDIKTKWGQYIDTDQLVDDMMALLTKYNHANTEHGVCCILDRFFTNKESLIKLLQKSDHYTGDLRIVLDEQIERRSCSNDINRWISAFPRVVKARDRIMKKTDANGKTMNDYLKVGKQKISVADLESEELAAALSTRSKALSEFTWEGFTVASETEYNNFISAIESFRYVTNSIMPDDIVESLEEYKIHKGTKTSRAFNKICHKFEIDNEPEYNKEFAKYADMVSGLKRDIKFFVSVNPLDYLTMSFGVNWASCHTIDKQNIRRIDNSYSGGYCGGTMSYMLDTTSIITYVHDTMPENHETGKVYRNMFHFGGDGVLLQSRIYPQGNDGSTDLYKEFRVIVQKEIAKVLELDSNNWIRRNSVTNVNTAGCHYPDYKYNAECNISYPAERPQCKTQTITVGSHRICPRCGESADNVGTDRLAHYTCYET